VNKGRVIILLALCSIIAFALTGCKGQDNKDSPLPKKLEISRVIVDAKEYFDINKMKIDKGWTFNNNDEMKVIFKGSVIGNLEPRTGKPFDNEYDTYYIKVIHNDNSIEEWVFWLDKQFSKDGVAENKQNRGRYKLINKKDVVEIGNLLNIGGQNK
jgi:hypothetical protein